MNQPESIVCKPTPWFLLRALVMMLMFGVFAVLFYRDGSTGYRKKNEIFYLYRTFEFANGEFSKMNSNGALTPREWKMHAEKQTVRFPDDRSTLPVTLKLPMPWPEILQDFDKMKPLQWNTLWLEYAKERKFPAHPGDEPYDARKINEQWVVFWICSALTSAAAFVLVRTLRRSISADDEAITSQTGIRVLYSDLKTLDLRKWETKGLAFLNYDGASGKGTIRIDGLTYGGFKKEDEEPAERLMQRVRSHFSGEILEYAPLATEAKNAASNSEIP
ncbi:MAG: hypothetical protein H8M99_04675 [Gloeobacteraceae cyanobacterium ES-bin-144]|nr:hypothetical protein [Verrucomicrobiales bacterium]